MTASDSTPEPTSDIPVEPSAPDPALDGAAPDGAALDGAALDGAALDGAALDGMGPGGSVRELAEIPAVEVITRAAVMLMSAAAEKLGLAEDGDRYLDRDEARRLITALGGLQAAFRDASPIPDPPGQGPGESIRRPPPL